MKTFVACSLVVALCVLVACSSTKEEKQQHTPAAQSDTAKPAETTSVIAVTAPLPQEPPRTEPPVRMVGRVVFDSGAPATNAMVWLQPVGWISPTFTDIRSKDASSNVVSGSCVRTDEKGEFTIRTFSNAPMVVVKALAPGFPAAWAGVFREAAPPHRSVDLVIPTSGPRLAGFMRDARGHAVTNAALASDAGPIAIGIEPDGAYRSERLHPGRYALTCTAPGFRDVKRVVVVQPSTTEPCDFDFETWPVITGRVLDAVALLPVPNVSIAMQQDGSAPNELCRSDDRGRFTFPVPRYGQFSFAHPTCATATWTCSELVDFDDELLALLSPMTTVKVHIDNIPPAFTNALYVHLWPLPKPADMTATAGQWRDPFYFYGQAVKDGDATFDGIALRKSPMVAGLMASPSGPCLALSGPVALTAGSPVEVRVALPHCGRLEVTMAEPFDRSSSAFQLEPRDIGSGMQSISDFHCIEITGNRLVWDPVPEGAYIASFYSRLLRGSSVFLTNISIAAGKTTKLMIEEPAATPLPGSIVGSLSLSNGYPLSGTVHSPGSADTLPFDGNFVVDNLDTARTHMVSIWPQHALGTNIFVLDVAPNGPPLDIVLGTGYRVTGTVVDRKGRPVRCTISTKTSRFEFGPGPFVLYPIFPGTYALNILADSYASTKRDVVVADRDIDLGRIVLEDLGGVLSGALVDEQGKRLANTIVILRLPGDAVALSATDSDGRFAFNHAPRGVNLVLAVLRGGEYLHCRIDPIPASKDLGEVKITPSAAGGN